MRAEQIKFQTDEIGGWNYFGGSAKYKPKYQINFPNRLWPHGQLAFGIEKEIRPTASLPSTPNRFVVVWED